MEVDRCKCGLFVACCRVVRYLLVVVSCSVLFDVTLCIVDVCCGLVFGGVVRCMLFVCGYLSSNCYCMLLCGWLSFIVVGCRCTASLVVFCSLFCGVGYCLLVGVR